MKIVSQSSDELVLKEGSASGIFLGIIFALAGALAVYFLHASSPVAMWIGLAFVVIGLGFVFFSSSITVDANKTSGQILYQTKRLIGGSSKTFAVADVLRIKTRKQWKMESGNNGGAGGRDASMPRQVLVSQSVIVFKDGQELPLDHQKDSSSGMSFGPVGSTVLMGGQGKEMAIATQVANFLGVPFQEIAPPGGGGGGMGINIGGGPGGIQL